jgi:transposase
MEEKQLLATNAIDTEDWKRTPPSVKKLVVQLSIQVEALAKQLQDLQQSNQDLSEKVNRNSKNSHSPPASDAAQVEKKKKTKKSSKKRGGQPGHQGHSRDLYPIEECTSITDHYPSHCSCCGEKLTGDDPNPHRHQIIEIPPIQLEIAEHRLRQLECPHCHTLSRAILPKNVTANRKRGCG